MRRNAIGGKAVNLLFAVFIPYNKTQTKDNISVAVVYSGCAASRATERLKGRVAPETAAAVV